MPHEFLEHTADVRMRVTGRSLEELFSAAVAGVMDLLAPQSLGRGQASRRTVAVAAADETALLVDFLNQVLLQAQVHRERYERVAFTRLSGRELTAELQGWPVQAFGGDIKAVTYHEADVRRSEAGGWETNLVFDI